MNRTVYYHHNVKVLEFMIEHLLRLAVRHHAILMADKQIGPFVPPYLQRVSEAIQSRGVSKQDFMEQARSDYIRLTEDMTWALVSALAESAAIPLAQHLAQKLLTRDILPHFMVETGKKELLKESLVASGFVEETDFHLVDLKTTMYKGNGDERVFVLGWEGHIEEVVQHSDTISALRDRPEAESLLIIIDPNKKEKIEKLVKENQFVV